MYFSLLLLLSFLLGFLLYPSSANAQPVLFCQGRSGINTALGCLNFTTGEDAVTDIATLAIGIAGGIAFILIIVAAFMITTSQGDPKRAKAGQELITSAIAGIILIVLSAVLLNFIGINILGLDFV